MGKNGGLSVRNMDSVKLSYPGKIDLSEIKRRKKRNLEL